MNKEEIIQKWLAGELSEAEKKAFEADDLFALDREIIENAQAFKAPLPDTSFETFRQKINAEKSTNVRPLVPWRSILKIASVVVISFALFYIFNNNPEVTVEALAANKTEVSLPDASAVTLNAASTLSYNKSEWNNNRKVSLKGEAYFKVAKGSSFRVITQNGTVTVLGTQFTVKQRNSFFEVVCFEGKVQVETNGRTEQLLPGKTFRSFNGNISLGTVSETQPAWITNQTHFTKVPYAEVLAELERQYDVQINSNTIDTQRIFTGSFTHTNLEAALKSVTAPLGLSYKINKKQVSLFIRAN